MRWASLLLRIRLCFSNSTTECFHLLTPLALTSTEIGRSTPPAFHHSRLYHHYALSHATQYPEEAALLSSLGDLKGNPALKIIHATVIKTGFCPNLLVVNRLLDLYLKFGNFGDAHHLFDEITDKDVRTWTLLISGFVKNGSFRTALGYFAKMQMSGVAPNHFTLSSVLKCCSCLSELRMGKGVHGWIQCNGFPLDVVLANSILDLYVKCGAYHYAEEFFGVMTERDNVTWNIMISAFLHNGDMEKSLHLFESLPSTDVVSWNTIIAGLLHNGFESSALDLLYQMAATGPLFNSRTFSIALALITSLSLLELGKQIHCRVLRLGIHDDRFVRDSLIDMYCKCREMEMASAIYKSLTQKMVAMKDSRISSGGLTFETVSCSSIVTGYVHLARWEEALNIFRDMVRQHVAVDVFTLTSVVAACALSGVLELGRQVHAHIQKNGHRLDAFLGSAMIDMYTKCGSLDIAQSIFMLVNDKNVVLWTAIISAYAVHGLGWKAISHFELMMDQGIQPNEISFVGILTACSHAGLIEEGCKYFELMQGVYGIQPGIEHFTCMVDLFGRAGRFDEAEKFIFDNDISNLCAAWVTLLASCRTYRNIELGKRVSQKLLHLQPSKAEHYVLMSNIYAVNHRWDKVANIRDLIKAKEIVKHPGQSWVQLKNQVCTFVMGDNSHSQIADIYLCLNNLTKKLKEIGYSSDGTQVMHDVEEEQREELVAVHSEKLAVAYAIIRTAGKVPIRIMKNLRICSDCHSFMKYASQRLTREIIVRDIHRFHLFKDGSCSCGDFW